MIPLYEQLNLFYVAKPRYKITKPIRLIELFAGIGSQAKALKNLGVNFEHYRVVEWDKYAINSYNSVHGTTFTTSDITKIKGSDLGIVEKDKYEYILTYSFPCQDLSLAGKMAGMTKGDKTRSGLLWEVERLLDECKELPQILLMENVPQVIGKKNINDFQLWQKKLEKLGYTNYVSILNAKDFGIPQNRKRCFMVSILGNYDYRFPLPKTLLLKLNDLLEDEVDEKYYLSDKMINYIIANNDKWTGNNEKSLINKDIASTITTGEGQRRCDASNYISKELPNNFNLKSEIKEVVNLYNLGIKQYNRRTGSVVNTGGISSTLLARTQGDNNLIAFSTTQQKYSEYSIKKIQNNIIKGDIVGTITANAMQRFNHDNCHMIIEGLRIRKLTPKECWRIMGFNDEAFDKASKVNSNTQLYKQAGNSIVVNVLMEIFKELL